MGPRVRSYASNEKVMGQAPMTFTSIACNHPTLK